MNILNKLSIKNLRMNKKRTISTIFGIILSIALICGVATLCTSFRESLIQNSINRSGYWHLNLNDVSNEQEEVLNKNIDIRDIYKVKEVGYSKLSGITNESKPYLKLYSMNNEDFNNLKFKMIKGRFPQNSNEIIISSHLEYNGGIEKKIGDKITLEVGERRTLEGDKLYSSNSYNSLDEKILSPKKYEFEIVGIIERPNYDFERYSDPGYTAITSNINQGTNNLFISFKKPNDYKQSISEILGANNYNEVEFNSANFKFNEFITNRELLKWEALAVGEDTMNALTTISGILIFIIIFTSVFCIRNSFAIATTERIKMYGMLASVGTTKKQIRKNVIFEALLLGLIGIPLGIISGLLAIFILLKVVNMLAGDFILNGSNLVFKTSAIAIALSIFLGFITVYFSAVSSAKKASKVSPIESLKNSNEIKLSKRKLKTPKLIKKIFGTGGVIAYKNLKRSKKKYRTTVISLAVSIFVFITMSSFLNNMFRMSDMYIKNLNYNLEIGITNKILNEDFEKILNLGNITEKHIIYCLPQTSTIEINDTSKFKNKFIESYDPITDEVKNIEIEKKYISIVGLDNSTYNKYLKELGISSEHIKNRGILYDITLEFDDKGREKEYRVYSYNKGDKIKGNIEYNKQEIEIEIEGIAAKGAIGFERSYSNGGYLFVNIDDFSNLPFEPERILINSDDPNTFESNFNKEFNSKKIRIDNIYKLQQQQKALSVIVSIFLYGFITVITLIGVTNIFNTITSNIELRQKEFAMLKSIGMTKKEFNKMINLETIFYSTKSLIYGIILGLIGTFALYKATSIKIESTMYIPIKPIIISIIAVFVLVFIIMKYSINKINKKNTIETIRNENI